MEGLQFLGIEAPCRRLGTLDIRPDMLLALLKAFNGTRRIQLRGLPADARVVAFGQSPNAIDTLRFYVESAELQAIPEGSIPPRLELSWTEFHGDAQPEIMPVKPGRVWW